MWMQRQVGCFCSNSNTGLSWMLTCLPLISLVSASPPSLVTTISIPAPIGREMAPQVARAQLPVAGPASHRAQHLIRSRIPAENIYWPAPVSALLRYLEDLCGNTAAYCTTPRIVRRQNKMSQNMSLASVLI